MSEPIRVWILDDHALFRDGVARLLAAEPGFEVAGTSADVTTTLTGLAGAAVDVIMVDLDLGGEDGADVIPRARAAGYAGAFLIVTAGLAAGRVSQLLGQGASGVFLKHSSPADLARGLRRVTEGEIWLDRRSVVDLGEPVRHDADGTPPALSRRERDILRGILEGLANKEIGTRLGISESSVKAGIQQLFRKTGVRTRSQLVRIALEQYRDEL